MSEYSLHISLFICTAGVVLGVVLEGAEHARDVRNKGWKPVTEKIGFAILVLGLAGELALQPFIDRADNDFRIDARVQIEQAIARAAEAEHKTEEEHLARVKIEERTAELRRDADIARAEIAKANGRTAEVEKESARLRKEAEQERLARVKIEERLAPRSLSAEQQQRATARLRQFFGQSIDIVSYPHDLEIENITNRLGALLQGSGWKIQSFGDTGASRRVVIGLLVESRTTAGIDFIAAKALVATLNAEHLIVDGPQQFGSDSELVTFIGPVGGPVAAIRLTVGKK